MGSVFQISERSLPRERYDDRLLKAFARDVQAGLFSSPKSLPCRYLYDEAGSSLFEKICGLPEYYLTRCERALLERHSAELAELLSDAPSVVELGSGTSEKTRVLLKALRADRRRFRYAPIDISRGPLEASARRLREDFPALTVTPVAAEYEEGVRSVLKTEPSSGRLVLWLGSSIGNLERAEAAAFLAGMRDSLKPSDRLLAGIDLRKDRRVLEAAYDDAQGVTAEFNRNVLRRINRDLRGEFRPERFRHRAVYRQREGRVEMGLVSVEAQIVPIIDLGVAVSFERGEAIYTENSYKYSLFEIRALASAAGFRLERQWLEGGYSLNLFAPQSRSSCR